MANVGNFWSSSLGPPPWRHPGAEVTPWRKYLDLSVPVLLAVATVLSMLHSQPLNHRLGSLGLASLAFAWYLVTTRLPPPRWRGNAWLIAVSFAGTLALAAILMFRDLLFLIFMIGSFVQATRVRPAPLGVLAVAGTSLLVNTIGVGGPGPALARSPVLWLTIVVAQTAAIAGSSMAGAKLAEQSEARRRAIAELETANEQNGVLQRKLLASAREAGALDERQRPSREIHDTLAQGLTGIITQLEATERSERWRRHVATAMALARENLTEARRSVHALRPEPLDTAQLPDALRGVAARWAERTSVAVEFTETGSPRPLHPEIESTLLRVTQEALSNVAKHAGAARVGITLSYMEDQVALDVRDDGSGFDPSGQDGFGLSGMRQRVARLMGTMAVESEAGAGTAVSASLPALDAR
jgi:signal transduction histidine kinase